MNIANVMHYILQRKAIYILITALQQIQNFNVTLASFINGFERGVFACKNHRHKNVLLENNF